MASQIDPNVIQDNSPVEKADLREQLSTAKTEITSLQQVVAIPYRMAFSDLDFDNL